MARSVLGSQVSAGVQTVASLALLVLLTRNTSVSTFGQYAVLLAASAMFSKFAGLNAYFFYRNRYPLVQYREALAILRQYMLHVLAFGLAIALAVTAINLTVQRLPLYGFTDAALWAALAFLTLVNIEMVRFYQAIGRNIFGLWLSTFAKVAAVCLVGASLLLGSVPLDLTVVLAILVGSQVLTIGFQLAMDPPFLQVLAIRPARFDWAAIAAGVSIMPTALFYDALALFDRLAIASSLGYDAAGHYSLASQGVTIAYAILGGSLVTLFYPRLVRAKAAGTTAVRRLVLQLGAIGLAACLAGAATIVLAAPLVPSVFGEEYRETVQVLQQMSLIPLCLFLLSTATHVAYLYDDVRISVAAFVLGILEFGLLCLLLIPRFGLAGAVFSVYVALASMIVAHIAILFRAGSGARREGLI